MSIVFCEQWAYTLETLRQFCKVTYQCYYSLKLQHFCVDVYGTSHHDFKECEDDTDKCCSKSDVKPYATSQEHAVCDNLRQNSKLYQCNLMWTVLETLSHGKEEQLDHPSKRIAKTTQILCDSTFHHILSCQLYRTTY